MADGERLVPSLDLRPDPRDAAEAMPSNIEAEHALLGAVLYDNDAFHRIEGLTPEHFSEPLHGEMYRVIAGMIQKQTLADPIIVHDKLKVHPAYENLGGVRYLADLFDRAPPAIQAPDYAKVIIDHATSRNLLRFSGEIAADARSPDLTSQEKIEGAEQRLFALSETGRGEGGFKSFSASLAGALENAAEAFRRDGKLSGISTGLIDLDQKLGGLYPSDLIIIAARPSMGKSALAANIAFNVARRYAYESQPDGTRKTVAGGIVGLFSLEMSAEQMAMRILAEVASIPSDKIRRGQIGELDYRMIADAAAEIDAAPLYIDDTGGMGIAKLCARARRLKRTVGLDLVIVDYLQLVTASAARRGDNRVQEVTEITQALKALAKELKVPVVACAQLSRQVESREDKRPQLADLRESGSIEQDADVVMSIYREAYYLSRTEPRAEKPEHKAWVEEMEACRGVAEIIIGKQRHGPIGTVKLHFDENLTKFSDPARESYASARNPYGNQ